MRRVVAGRFVIEAPLGAGGMGSIYRARDEQRGELVAIKILKPALLDDPILRERFRREALSLAKLRHAGIVTVLDFGEADGDLYTVLELVDGETLARILELRGAMSFVDAAPILDQILAALEVCHDHDIVHRDIKPSNVMVSSDGGVDRVTLIDFGLARMTAGAIEKLTETGAVHGTPSYMAPEQCRGEDVGPAGDVYSAGVLFYEVLSGAQPFHGNDGATLMAQHLFVEPTPLRQVAPHVAPGVAATVHAALAKQPHERPTARELRTALARAGEGADPEAQAERAAALRRHTSGLPRSERAISEPARVHASEPPIVTVLVWIRGTERSAALQGCIGAAGLACTVASTDDVPEISRDDVVVIVSARDGLDRLGRLRTIRAQVPIVVIDVAGPEETTLAIRAGASDMLLREAHDADVIAKIERLLRRRARR